LSSICGELGHGGVEPEAPAEGTKMGEVLRLPTKPQKPAWIFLINQFSPVSRKMGEGSCHLKDDGRSKAISVSLETPQLALADLAASRRIAKDNRRCFDSASLRSA